MKPEPSAFIAEAHRNWREWKKDKKAAKKARKEKQLEKQKALESEEVNNKLDEKKATVSEKGRHYTVSVALAGSILDNAQSAELRTYLAGQIARAAVVFNVDEIVVFDDEYRDSSSEAEESERGFQSNHSRRQGCVQLARILQYLECPQYLRKHIFPLHKDLAYAGVLNPLDAPHHLRAEDYCEFREGIVVNRLVKQGKGSLVNAGLTREVQIDRELTPGLRVTVRIKEEMKKKWKGEVVSPQVPRTESGLYWGYEVRLVSCLSDVFLQCPFSSSYDLTIGTSERGTSVDDVKSLPRFEHLLIVFGGVKGLEAALESDKMLKVDDPSLLFKYYLNTCPSQGSRTIRTEEALLISLAALRPKIVAAIL